MKGFPATIYPVSLFLCGAFALFLLAGCASSNNTQETEDSENVDIGYGSVDRDNVNSAVATVEGEEGQGRRAKTLSELLQGQVAGVEVSEVSGGLRVRIRGQSNSFMSGTEPLFVLDGMPMRTNNGTLYGVNPADVESITILKDAASTAIYGSQGANGVILIKTKAGK